MQPAAIYPDLRDRSVYLTGGGSGIGAAVAKRLLADGLRQLKA